LLLRNAWYIAAWADELGEAPLGRRICNDPIVLFRDQAGKPAALADRCCHRSAPLSLGNVVDGGLQCGYHGLIFDASGRCVTVPGQRLIPETARVRSYPAVEKDQLVWVWMGDAAIADPTSIVDFPYHNDPAHWPNKHAVDPIKANYTLMVDNLMDLTHLGYLHARTVGGNPAAHVAAEMKTVRTPNGLKFTRWLRNSLPPPSFVKAGLRNRIDRCQEFEFFAPSTILQWGGATDAGSECDDPQRNLRFQFRLFHGLTPETETSCFYFWSAANGYRQNDPEVTEQLYREVAPTFLEDKVMAEAQQLRLDKFGEEGLVDIASDANRIRMRRIVERLVAAEQAASAVARTPSLEGDGA
jgi:phenylpropionate dioxygenase-like ring-hydroxylating dioxygenase large terminal subunit